MEIAWQSHVCLWQYSHAQGSTKQLMLAAWCRWTSWCCLPPEPIPLEHPLPVLLVLPVLPVLLRCVFSLKTCCARSFSILQVVLDTAQLVAVILSQDLLWKLPDWAAAGLSGVIITQATSWQWVPFDCLLLTCPKHRGQSCK